MTWKACLRIYFHVDKVIEKDSIQSIEWICWRRYIYHCILTMEYLFLNIIFSFDWINDWNKLLIYSFKSIFEVDIYWFICFKSDVISFSIMWFHVEDKWWFLWYKNVSKYVSWNTEML